jgi:DNA-binding NtrC family response regulator
MIKRGKILIVDDNEDILFTLKMLLRPIAESITTLNDPRELLPVISRTRFDVILLDMNFRQDAVSGKEGFHWLEEILKLDAKAVVIFITAYADTEKAVQAIKQGAADFIPKPWQNEKLIATVSSALQLSFSRTEVETLKQQKEALKEQTEALTLPPEPTRVIGESAAMQAIFQTIRKFSETDANLLLLGENGTGKDLIARFVYEQSPRKNEIYVPIDLGSIPDTLFESELFGYEKGAFTDARKNKPGRVEVASGGTLFLNEIGNLSLPLQAKLLSIIEQRKSSRLGSTTSYPVDVRLICATNTDLYSAIDDGQFRQDLLYRINTIEIRIPPLRERGNDLFLLADFFLQRYRKKYKKELRGISKEARKTLQLYRWPGNVRELEHAIERAVILSTGTMLTPDDFMLRSPRSSNTVSEKDKYNLERMEKDAINEVMRMCGGNITLAAEMLGITRTSLYRRIEKFGL